MLLIFSPARRVQFWALCLVILANTINGQFNPGLCPQGTPPSEMDPKWSNISNRFEIITELVGAGDNRVAEISQAFSSRRDAVIFSSVGNVNFYWDFSTNETFQVLPIVINQQQVMQCLREEINDRSQTSVIQPNTLFLKPSVLLGYDHLNQHNPDWRVRFVNESMLRGVPVNVFSACFYVSDIQATVAATYYTSDTTKFQGYLQVNRSIILQIDAVVQKNTGQSVSYTFNVFRYIPNPGRREERQALETPSGVFCPNRINTLPVPSNLPERVSSNFESFTPQFNFSIISGHSLYDTLTQFTRFDVYFPDLRTGLRLIHWTEIHDFATGLSYRYEHHTRQCKVSDLQPGAGDTTTVDGNPNLLQLGNPAHLFQMDDIIYQYTGEKRCRDRVWCHVWIGEKPLPEGRGFQHQEWHWASSVNGEPLNPWVPMKFITNTLDGNRTIQRSAELNIFDFRRNPMTIFEIDYTMADCYRAMGPEEKYNLGVISFTIANDKAYPVLKNMAYLQFTIWETMTLILGIRPVRISHIIVDQDGKDIFVTLTLLDAPPRLGPVQEPLQEASLTSLVERLRAIIDSNGLAFRARYESKEVMLRARPKTFNVIHTSLEQKWKSTGATITGLWIGFIIIGLIVGTVSGYFGFRVLANKT